MNQSLQKTTATIHAGVQNLTRSTGLPRLRVLASQLQPNKGRDGCSTMGWTLLRLTSAWMGPSIIARQTFEARCRTPKAWAKKPKNRLPQPVWLEIRAELDARANLKLETVRRLKHMGIQNIGQVHKSYRTRNVIGRTCKET